MASESGPESDTAGVTGGEWQGWGTSSPLPAAVAEVIGDLKSLERDFDQRMSFGGLGGKLQGNFKVQEDKKHRAVYQSLTDSETKLQFFSARQVACRMLGSRGYLCQKVGENPGAGVLGAIYPLSQFIVEEGQNVGQVLACYGRLHVSKISLILPVAWNKILALYASKGDFLRQNNTGKLLWQIFGTQTASMCLFGIHEHEEIMWDSFRQSGKSMVWFLYPNKNASPKSVQDVFDSSFTKPEGHKLDPVEKPVHFVLIDGTWSNSAAMYRRLKDKWASLWGEEDLPCVSLSTTGASVMHRLRPQPSWDRTCTAAAASGILSELSYHYPELSLYGLDKQAEAIENGLDVLLEALTARRIRMGRSIVRKKKKQHLRVTQ